MGCDGRALILPKDLLVPVALERVVLFFFHWACCKCVRDRTKWRAKEYDSAGHPDSVSDRIAIYDKGII